MSKGIRISRFWVSETGHKSLDSRIQGIMKIKAPKTKKHVRMFVSNINFIKNHIKDRAKIVEPITKLTKDKIKWQWKEEQQKAIEATKAKTDESIVLVCPDVNKTFHLHTDACDVQVGGTLVQDNQVLEVYSTKLTEAKQKYQVTEKDLLAIDKCLAAFSNMVRGADIASHADHENLTHGPTAKYQSERVSRQMIANAVIYCKR